MTAKTSTPRTTSEDIRMVLRLAELAVFDPRVKQTFREASEEIARLDGENASLREQLSRVRAVLREAREISEQDKTQDEMELMWCTWRSRNAQALKEASDG